MQWQVHKSPSTRASRTHLKFDSGLVGLLTDDSTPELKFFSEKTGFLQWPIPFYLLDW